MSSRGLYVVALGCPKNRVDVETVVALAAAEGFALVDQPEAAEVLLVGTCGFVADACQESVNTVLELAQRRQPGARLVVAGCMAQRFGQDLATAMPEADFVVGTADLSATFAALCGQGPNVAVTEAGSDLQTRTVRQPSLYPGSAYLKVADGCSRRCAFCTIPSLRGPFQSRPIADLCDEARDLARQGVHEVNLVAQDLSSFGRDREGGETLPALLRALAPVDGLRWIRPLYLYPERSLDDIVDVMAQESKVVPYLDLPVQHGSDAVLRCMKRGHRASLLGAVFAEARARLPQLVLRTTVIVGHPGEDAAAFAELLGFIERVQFDHLGAFRFSPEEGTASAEHEDQVSRRDSYNRYRKVMALQRRISRRRGRAYRGQVLDVLVEGPSEDSSLVYVGRHAGQAPEVDGLVYLDQPVEPGSMVQVRIVDSGDYDLVGEVLS
jgi:ribosomal protein S12 methylthiotransferase